jgi:cobalt-zinc-cadmium efflux system membrane fusion protein
MTAFLLSACQDGPEPEPATVEDQAEAESTQGAHDSTEPDWAGTESLTLTGDEISSLGLQTIQAEHRSLATRLSVMGRVLENRTLKAIVSYPFSARIARIDVGLGEWVEPGQTLVLLQSEEVGVAISEFYKAEADHALAQVDYERESQLFENGVGARKNFSAAEAGLRVAEANLDAAEKKLHVLGFTEEQMHLLTETHQVSPNIPVTAPIAGKVVANSAVLGGMVDESTEILTILDPTHLWVEADVYERDIARVALGQRVEITVPAYPDETFLGTITYISDLLDPESRTITVRTEVANPNLKLKPGMFADIVIELSKNGGGLALPSEAILDDEGHALIFVRRDDHTFEPRRVVSGTMEEGWIEIAEGLAPGDVVVTTGNFQLKSLLYQAVLEAGHIH